MRRIGFGDLGLLVGFSRSGFNFSLDRMSERARAAPLRESLLVAH